MLKLLSLTTVKTLQYRTTTNGLQQIMLKSIHAPLIFQRIPVPGASSMTKSAKAKLSKDTFVWPFSKDTFVWPLFGLCLAFAWPFSKAKLSKDSSTKLFSATFDLLTLA